LLFFYKYDILLKALIMRYGGTYMLPFYFLSVTTNLMMGGILLLSAKDKEEFSIKYPLLNDPTFLLVLLIFSGISAVFKLLSPVEGNTPIIGDIVPALSGVLGCIVFFERWVKASENQLTLPPFFARILTFEQPIGFFCLFAGVTHLLFSSVLFL
jgi:hypothetical protein